jgi:hypothetical protein
MTDDQVPDVWSSAPRRRNSWRTSTRVSTSQTQLAISLIEDPRIGESVNDLRGRGGGAQPKARVVKIRCPTAAFHM